VYNPVAAKKETRNAQKIVQRLYEHFLKHENQLPSEYNKRKDGIERKVVDYVAGMTDQYAEIQAREVLRKND
jgi:dGTPase